MEKKFIIESKYQINSSQLEHIIHAFNAGKYLCLYSNSVRNTIVHKSVLDTDFDLRWLEDLYKVVISDDLYDETIEN